MGNALDGPLPSGALQGAHALHTLVGAEEGRDGVPIEIDLASAALAASRRAGLTTPDKEDLVILPLGGEQLFAMSYHGPHLHGDIFDVAIMKEALLRPGVAPGAAAGRHDGLAPSKPLSAPTVMR